MLIAATLLPFTGTPASAVTPSPTLTNIAPHSTSLTRVNIGKYLLSAENIAAVVHPDEELTLVYGPRQSRFSADVGYSYLSVDVPKTAIVKIRTYRGDYASYVKKYVKKHRYNLIRVTKKYWSGYSVRRDGIYYTYVRNVGQNILAEGTLIIPADSDSLDRDAAVITTRNLALLQEEKLNRAGYGSIS